MIDTKIATTSLGTWPALGWPFGWRSAHCARRARLACPQEASLLDLVALGTVADTGWRGARPGHGAVAIKAAACLRRTLTLLFSGGYAAMYAIASKPRMSGWDAPLRSAARISISLRRLSLSRFTRCE